MHTFRRLNDPERYYGLSWRGWLAAGAGGGAAVRRGQGLAVRAAADDHDRRARARVLRRDPARRSSGQAIGPGRHLAALVRYRLAPKR